MRLALKRVNDATRNRTFPFLSELVGVIVASRPSSCDAGESQLTRDVQSLRAMIPTLRTMADFRAMLLELARLAGLSSVLWRLSAGFLDERDEGFLVSTMDPSLESYFRAQDYCRTSGLLRMALHCGEPVDWSSLDTRNPCVRAMFEDFRKHGLGAQAVSFPVYGPRHRFGIITAAAAMPPKSWREFLGRASQELHSLARDIHSAGERVLPPEPSSPTMNLSRRERECLSMCAKGLRDSQIAKQLKIREGVVRRHIDNARLKLGTPNRSAATREAIYRGDFL